MSQRIPCDNNIRYGTREETFRRIPCEEERTRCPQEEVFRRIPCEEERARCPQEEETRCNTREALLKRVQRYSFMTDDLRLFLNTHPCSQEALEALKRYLALAREAKKDYEQAYGPLTLEAMETRCQYDWICGPWPWEVEA